MIRRVALSFVPIAIAIGASGCAHGAGNVQGADRKAARATILLVAQAVKIADERCAGLALEVRDRGMATTCANAYDVARSALIAAESGIDAWENGTRHKVACAAIDAGQALKRAAEVIEGRGSSLPAVVIDALRLVPELAKVCHG